MNMSMAIESFKSVTLALPGPYQIVKINETPEHYFSFMTYIVSMYT